MIDMKELAEKLKAAREKAGLKVQELDLRAGLKAGYVWSLENHRIKRAPNPTYWARILEVLGLTEEELLAGKPGRPAVSKPASVSIPDTTLVPVLGEISAGPFRVAEQSAAMGFVAGTREDQGAYALTVRGDSMEPDFKSGDTIFLKHETVHFPPIEKGSKGNVPLAVASRYNGRICAILVDDASTLKKVEVETKGHDYHVHFVPFNRDYDRLTLKGGQEATIQGFVYKVIRRIR